MHTGVFAVFIACAIKAACRDLHQTCALAVLTAHTAQGLTGCCTAQTGHGLAHQVNLDPAQFKAFQRLAGFGIFGQASDLAIGHVQHHRGVCPILGLHHQTHACAAVSVGWRGQSNADAPVHQSLCGLVEVERQASTDQAIVGGQ